MYTIVKEESGASLNVREYDTSLIITKDYNIHITNNEWKKIKHEVESNCFWSTRRDMQGGGTGTWIIEGFDPKGDNCAGIKYHYAMMDYNTEWDFGNIGRKIKQYAKEEKLIIY